MEREAGFLTSPHREFLEENDHDAKTSGEHRATRWRIREKTRGGVHDFAFLLKHLPATERRQAFAGKDEHDPEEPGQPWQSGAYEWGLRAGMQPGESFVKGDEELVDAIADTVTFLWLACYDAHVSPKDVFETAIAATRRDSPAEHNAEIEIETVVDPDRREALAVKGRKKMARGEELLNAEASALVKKPEEVVPNGLVFDYLRGEIDTYSLPPFPSEAPDSATDT